MSYNLEAQLNYSGGHIGVEFLGDDRPDDWNTEYSAEAEHQVKKALFDLSPVQEWESSFETTQIHSPPGATVHPTVGTVHVTEDGDITVDLDVDSVHDCDWQDF